MRVLSIGAVLVLVFAAMFFASAIVSDISVALY